MDTTARLGSGSTLVIKGELRAQEDVVIAGRIEGTIHIPGYTLMVHAGGQVDGDIHASQVVVAGRVTGMIVADDRIELRETARVGGDLSAPRLSMVDGAEVNGRVDMPAADKSRLSLAS
jgi:cytoskeletal protein CcmA (bactofilin family)